MKYIHNIFICSSTLYILIYNMAYVKDNEITLGAGKVSKMGDFQRQGVLITRANVFAPQDTPVRFGFPN